MKTERDERDELGREDAQWLEQVRALYAPEPPDAAKRAAFDAKLRERLERKSASLPWLPAFGAAALAGVLAWYALPGATPEIAPELAHASPANSRWEQALFYSDLTRQSGESEELPPEYQAIEVAFFDDV